MSFVFRYYTVFSDEIGLLILHFSLCILTVVDYYKKVYSPYIQSVIWQRTNFRHKNII